MKKLFLSVLVCALLAGLCSCGSKDYCLEGRRTVEQLIQERLPYLLSYALTRNQAVFVLPQKEVSEVAKSLPAWDILRQKMEIKNIREIQTSGKVHVCEADVSGKGKSVMVVQYKVTPTSEGNIYVEIQDVQIADMAAFAPQN
ncbi:MAG: hypothetical protein GXO20_01305 [Thermodesulfobacteria bacterium]|nr:hypothetical protein [Thermodesulfobacteriota bacterium]